VFTIILAGYLTDMQHYLVRVSHYAFGWWVFAGAMIAFFAIVRRFFPEPPAEGNSPEFASGTGGAAAPSPGVIGAALFALALAPAWHLITDPERHSPAVPGAVLPVHPGDWAGPTRSHTGWRPVFEGADILDQGVYRQARKSEDAGVEAFTAIYSWQRHGRKLGGYNNTVIGDLRLEESHRVLRSGRGYVELIVTDASHQQWLIWYSYSVGERRFTSTLQAQVWYGVGSLLNARISRVLALRAKCASDCNGARGLIGEFIDDTDHFAAATNPPPPGL
jgi:hypothetical protein